MVTKEVVFEQITFYAWILVAALVIGGMLWYFMYYRKFNKIVWVRDESSAGNRLFVDKARVIVDKNKVEMWQTFKTKIKMSPPSAEAITLTNKGVQMAELLRYGKDNYKWICFHKMPLENKEVKPTLLTTAQKQVLANQFRMAMEESNTSGNKLLEKAVPIVIIFVLLLFGYLHFDLYAKNSQRFADSNAGLIAQQKEISEQNARLIEAVRDIVQNRQVVEVENKNKTPTGIPVPN